MMKHYNCILCNARTKPKNRKNINPAVQKYLRRKFFITEISQDDKLCNKCLHKYYKSENNIQELVRETTVQPDYSDPDYVPSKKPRISSSISSPPSVLLNIPSTSKSHARCFVCKRQGSKMFVLSQDARFKAFIDSNILIPAGARCCGSHLDSHRMLTSESFTNINTQANSSTNRTSIVKLLEHLRQTCLKSNNRINFDNIDKEDCINLTGLSQEQFDDLCSHIIIHVKNTPSRTPKTSIGIFLMKLKCALSNKLLSTLFKISVSSIRRAVHTVRHALMRLFVSLYLGFDCFTREDIIKNHTRPLAKSLLCADGEKVILVLDGTYIYIQKSKNFSFQRRSYSLHKSRPLVKPMVVVTTTGHFVAILGPYLAKNNDASILNHMLQRNINDIKEFIKEDDIFVVDRGFRDSLSLLEDLGIQTEMPAFMKKGDKQMSDNDANTSRMVTKVFLSYY